MPGVSPSVTGAWRSPQLPRDPGQELSLSQTVPFKPFPARHSPWRKAQLLFYFIFFPLPNYFVKAAPCICWTGGVLLYVEVISLGESLELQVCS